MTSDLGGGLAGGDPFSAQLGPVTVADERGALTATWESLVFAFDFQTGAGTGPEIIPVATNVEYWSGPATATEGTGTFVPGQATAGAAEFLNGIVGAFDKTSGSGNNSATWNPTIVVTPPAGSVTGVYTSTIVHTFV